MDTDWNLFINLEKEDNKLQKNPINVNNVNKVNEKNEKFKTSRYNYIIEENKEEETDFFKKRPIKEKNMYINSFSQYKLKK